MKSTRTRLARTIADKTLKQGVSKKLSQQIAAYLLSERRVGEVDSLLRDVMQAWAEAGHVEVLARSAHPLTGSVRADIRRQIKAMYPAARQIVVTEVHDPQVIGGVRLELADRQLDVSVAAKLNKFKQLTAA